MFSPTRRTAAAVAISPRHLAGLSDAVRYRTVGPFGAPRASRRPGAKLATKSEAAVVSIFGALLDSGRRATAGQDRDPVVGELHTHEPGANAQREATGRDIYAIRSDHCRGWHTPENRGCALQQRGRGGPRSASGARCFSITRAGNADIYVAAGLARARDGGPAPSLPSEGRSSGPAPGSSRRGPRPCLRVRRGDRGARPPKKDSVDRERWRIAICLR